MNKGTNIVTYSLTCGTNPTCSFNIVVYDGEAPRPTSSGTLIRDVVPNFHVNPWILLTPLVNDNCTLTPPLKRSVIQKSVFADVTGCATKSATLKYFKSNTRTYVATDESGNTATTSQIVYIRDMEAPVPVCTAVMNITVGNTNVTVPAANFNNGSYDTQNNSIAVATCNASVTYACTNFSSSIVFSRSMIPVGQSSIVIPIRVRITDGCGNIAYCYTTVNLIKAVV